MTFSRKDARPLPKPKPRVVEQRERRAALAATITAVRQTVWRRDHGRCRACQRRGQHVHHLRFRSLGGRWTTGNTLVLCKACHQDVHARILVITGTDANVPDGLTFERCRWVVTARCARAFVEANHPKA